MGSSSLAGSANDSFITAPDGVGVTDLNSLFDLPEGVILYRAIDINNNGQVIATGIPAPETYAVTARKTSFSQPDMRNSPCCMAAFQSDPNGRNGRLIIGCKRAMRIQKPGN